MLLKAIAIWLVFILAESFNGTVRIFWLVPSLGDVRAHQISFVMGSLLIVIIATIFNKWLDASRMVQLLGVGLVWVALTVVFEVLLGRVAFGYSWETIAADYDLVQGGLMPFGLLLLILAPAIALKIRSLIVHIAGYKSIKV